MCFQRSSELQFGRHISNEKLSRVEYANKLINIAKGLIPPSFETEIVSKLSRHFNDDVKTDIIIRNVQTYDNLIEFNRITLLPVIYFVLKDVTWFLQAILAQTRYTTMIGATQEVEFII